MYIRALDFQTCTKMLRLQEKHLASILRRVPATIGNPSLYLGGAGNS